MNFRHFIHLATSQFAGCTFLILAISMSPISAAEQVPALSDITLAKAASISYSTATGWGVSADSSGYSSIYFGSNPADFVVLPNDRISFGDIYRRISDISSDQIPNDDSTVFINFRLIDSDAPVQKYTTSGQALQLIHEIMVFSAPETSDRFKELLVKKPLVGNISLENDQPNKLIAPEPGPDQESNAGATFSDNLFYSALVMVVLIAIVTIGFWVSRTRVAK